MKNQWNELGNRIDAFVADNVEIAWPVIFKHLEKTKQGMRVLDYGCGTGALCRELHRRGYIVVGVDTSEELLKIAKKQSSKEIKYVHGSQESLQVHNGKLDVITSVMVLQFIDDIRQIADAMYSSLKQDGILSITVFNPDFVSRCAGLFFNELDKSGIPWTVKTHFGDIVVDTYIRDKAQYRHIFENAGFTFCSAHYPLFTKGFLEKHGWPLPLDVPEYLIMKFRK
ncbi:MAG: class I SAM-dependent methyltransferase [Candidatus Woesearchaeota archaeon]